MPEYIEKMKAISAIKRYEYGHCPEYMQDWATKLKRAILADLTDDVMEMPAADVAPVVHARWIIEEREFFVKGKDGFVRQERRPTFTCSNPKCGVGVVGLENMKYCPNCGARMDGE